MATTIQISESLLKELKGRKLYEKESYEEVLWDILEDSMELSEEAKRDIIQSEKEFSEGKTHTLEEVKRELRL
ncbi:hypothetical protein A3K63_03500 [Candidatus Micrarchaeota archaeon RBG_16_49_10]|nr:MAG: hypothetical protein A3K63_03500 [Candidatus Micrarchaeota archaeon RBG_16_49_10]